jgi:hypothetical protein
MGCKMQPVSKLICTVFRRSIDIGYASNEHVGVGRAGMGQGILFPLEERSRPLRTDGSTPLPWWTLRLSAAAFRSV